MFRIGGTEFGFYPAMDSGDAGGGGAGFGVDAGSADIGMPGTDFGGFSDAGMAPGTTGLSDSFGNTVGTGFGGTVGVGISESGGTLGVPGSLSFYGHAPNIGQSLSNINATPATPFGYASINPAIAPEQASMLAEQTGAFGNFGEAATLGAVQSVDPSAGPSVATNIAKGIAGFVNPLAPFAVQGISNAMNHMSAGYGMAPGFTGMVGSTLGAATGIPGLSQLGGQLGASLGMGSPGGGFAGQSGTAGGAPGGSGGVMGTGITLMDLVKGGLGVYQANQNQKALQSIANQQAALADPFRAQRGGAVNAAGAYAADPTSNPLYQQSLAEAEKALARKQAASGRYFSGGALAEAGRLPASVMSALQNQSVGNQAQIAQAAQGAPATAAQLYGQSATGAAAADASKIGSFFAPYNQRQSEQGILAMLRGA